MGAVALPVQQLDPQRVLPVAGDGKDELVPQPVLSGRVPEALARRTRGQVTGEGKLCSSGAGPE